MGIGHQALAVFEEIIDNKEFNGCKSVIETGSQFIDGHYQERAKFLIYNYSKKVCNKDLSAKDFYFDLGFEDDLQEEETDIDPSLPTTTSI